MCRATANLDLADAIDVPDLMDLIDLIGVTDVPGAVDVMAEKRDGRKSATNLLCRSATKSPGQPS